MSRVTVITDTAVSVPGTAEAGRMLIAARDLELATGWVRKPEGLCRGDVCVPVRDPASLEVGVLVDLVSFASALGRRSIADHESGIIALAGDSQDRRGALEGLVAPDFVLPDLEGVPHRFSDTAGHKRVLVTFSSWCGCRYDLPGWQALADELAPNGLRVITVALDDDPEVVRPFTEGISIPVLLDRQHLLSEIYAISNVPTVVWIDEEGVIVRPNGLIFGTDTFSEFTGVDSTPHLEAIRRWAIEGTLPMEREAAAGAIADLSDDEIDARLHFRVGVEAKALGYDEVAARHLVRASDLVPYDFSVRRAAMPLLGKDPFGQEFLDVYDEWQAQGAPYHGIPVNPD